MGWGRRRAISGLGAVLLAFVGIGVIDKALAATVLFCIALVLLVYFIFEPPISQWAGKYPWLVRLGLGDASVRRRQISAELSALADDGDHAWNAAFMAHQMAEENAKQEEQYRRAGRLYEFRPGPVSEWWAGIEEWRGRAHAYLASAPELCDSHLGRWHAQEPELPALPRGKPPLSHLVRTEQDMAWVRLKQALLREWADEFADRP